MFEIYFFQLRYESYTSLLLYWYKENLKEKVFETTQIMEKILIFKKSINICFLSNFQKWALSFANAQFDPVGGCYNSLYVST